MLEIWAVYEQPLGYPNQYVARKWVIDGGQSVPTVTMRVAPSLEGVRALLPAGLVRLPRDPRDEPHIVETWL